jgi:hypothetical protein
VVTSRPTAAVESWLAGESFAALEIQPMTVADIEAFVDHWHAAMAVDGKETDRIESSRVALAEAVRTRRHLRMLAVNPLMTALICALHLDRRMQLPDDRMELYGIALDMLLERRDTERRIKASDVTILRADKLLILEDLAYWLVRNGRSVVSRDRVEELLASKLAEMHRVEGSTEDVLKYLLERTGLLRMPMEGQIDFVHKTFQEYLAARAAVAADDIGLLVQNAHDDQWREVVLMAAGHARPRQVTELLHRLLERADQAPDQQHVLRVLAVGASQHAPQLPPDLREHLNEVAGKLLPPQNPNDAVALAAAGELVLELLPVRDRYSPSEVGATVRMAAAIGGNHGLSVIARCTAGLKSVPMMDLWLVSEELTKAWPAFDPVEFAERVLAGSSFGDVITVNDPSVLSGLRHVRPSSLTCTFQHGHGNVDYLADLPLLVVFTLNDARLHDLSAIARHPNLGVLDLTLPTTAVDLRPIGQCESLRELRLFGGPTMQPEQLREIGQITSLGLHDRTASVDVVPHLAHELRLKHLMLRQTDGGQHVAGLLAAPQLDELRTLWISDRGGPCPIDGIGRLADTLTRLTLHVGRLVDVSALGGLPRLECLSLEGTPVESLEFVRGLTKLTELRLGGVDNQNPDLTPLCDLPALRSLYFPSLDMVDLSGLAGASDLEVHVVGSRSTMVEGTDKLPSSVHVTFDL